MAIVSETKTYAGTGGVYGTGTTWYTTSNLSSADALVTSQAIIYLSSSRYLVGTNYGFSAVPAVSPIVGIVCKVKGYAQQSGLQISSVKMFSDGALAGSELVSSPPVMQPGLTVHTFGSSSVCPVAGLMGAGVRDAGFGGCVRVYASSGPPESNIVYVDYIELTIYWDDSYVPPAPAPVSQPIPSRMPGRLPEGIPLRVPLGCIL